MLVTCTATAAVSVGIESAATLGGVNSGRIAAGDTPIESCDADGFTVSYSTAGGNVVQATAADIADPACEGGSLSITVTNASGDSIASGGPASIPTDGDSSPNSLTVAVSPQPAAEQVAGVRVAVVGP